MAALAKTSGCALCHMLEPRKAAADELLPYGPSWTQIARRYRNDPAAADRLTDIVIKGSGIDQSNRHWRGKSLAADMPANKVEISEPDARALVGWILRQ